MINHAYNCGNKMAINKQHFMCWVVVYSCWRALYVNNRLLQFIIDESVQAFLPLNMANMFFAKRSKKNPKNPKYVLFKKKCLCTSFQRLRCMEQWSRKWRVSGCGHLACSGSPPPVWGPGQQYLRSNLQVQPRGKGSSEPRSHGQFCWDYCLKTINLCISNIFCSVHIIKNISRTYSYFSFLETHF